MKQFVKLTFLSSLLVVVLPGRSYTQQKVQFTQYMFNGLVINPAYAGADEALSLTFIQRSQWTGVENAPDTQTLSGHTLFKKKQVGLGITLVNDQIGVHRNINALMSYAYHIRVAEKSYLSMGLQAGVKSFKSDYASLSNSNNDPGLSNLILQKTYFDLATGIYYRSPRFHLGISAPELLPQSFNVNDTLNIRLSKANFFLFSKYRFTLSENYDLEPSVLIKYLDGVPLSYDINLSLIYRKVLSLGFSYRKKESVDFILKAQVTRQLQIGYAYDYPIGIISQFTNGSHELMINYLFRYSQKNVTSPR